MSYTEIPRRPKLGSVIKEQAPIMGFDRETSSDERDHSFHFIIYTDGSNIYAWDPVV